MVRRRTVLPVLLLALVGVLAGGCAERDRSSDRPQALPAASVEHAVLPSIVRLTPAIRLDGRADVTDSITLDAARGEREAAQLVAWASEGEPRVVVEASALRGEGGGRIPAANVRTFIEHAMRVERGSPAGRSGTYVDPLIPAAGRDVVLGADERLLAWVDVEVPRDARPGSYVGAVRVRRADESGRPIGGDEGILLRVPVRVRVHAATIPHVPTLASHVGFDQSQLVRFEGVAAGSAALRDVTERYAAELAAARLSIADVGALPPGALPGHRGLPGDGAYLRRVFGQRGVASVRVPFYIDYPFADPLGRDRAAAVAYLRAAGRWARREGWGDRAYVFAIDEPDEADAGAVRELHELVEEADPSLELLVTREASAKAFAGSVDIWAPNINPARYRPADVAREARAGRDTWWYPSITTWQPYPTLFVDELRPTPRALGWLAWREGVRGFLYWTATHWHEVDDPYRESNTYNETDAVGNGDGVLLYPGGPIGLDGTPVPSVRLMQLRDGIEDHDLLVLATCAGTPAERAQLRRAAAAAAPALDRVEPTEAQVNSLRTAAFSVLDRAPRAADCRTIGR